MQAEVRTGTEVVAARPAEVVVKKPVVPEKLTDDVSDLFVVTDDAGRKLTAEVQTPAQRIAAERLAAQRQAAAEREALAQREAVAQREGCGASGGCRESRCRESCC